MCKISVIHTFCEFSLLTNKDKKVFYISFVIIQVWVLDIVLHVVLIPLSFPSLTYILINTFDFIKNKLLIQKDSYKKTFQNDELDNNNSNSKFGKKLIHVHYAPI